MLKPARKATPNEIDDTSIADEFGFGEVGTQNHPTMIPARPPSATRSSSESKSTMRASPWALLTSSRSRIRKTQAPSSPYKPGSIHETSRLTLFRVL